MGMIEPEMGSYLFRTSLFFGVQFVISGTIFLAFVTGLPIASKFRSRAWAPFCSKRVSVASLMLAVAPVMAIPIISVALTWASRNDVAISGVMRWKLLPISVVIVIAAAAIEEFLFRGVLLRILLRYSRSPVFVCVALQSIVFALFHGEAARASLVNFFGFFSVGLLLGLAYQGSKVLWVPILLHSWSNIWSGLLVGGSASWFAGPLFNEKIDYFTEVKRLAVVASVLLLLRFLRASEERAGAQGRVNGNT